MKSNPLLLAALEAQNNAYAPYSHYPVGAAVLSLGNVIYSGCNVENASYGCTICAERSALVAMVSAGETEFTVMALITIDQKTPCGICLQFMSEFAHEGGAEIMLSTPDLESVKKVKLSDLMPSPFILGAAEPRLD